MSFSFKSALKAKLMDAGDLKLHARIVRRLPVDFGW
jgi:hypothetical protein